MILGRVDAGEAAITVVIVLLVFVLGCLFENLFERRDRRRHPSSRAAARRDATRRGRIRRD